MPVRYLDEDDDATTSSISSGESHHRPFRRILMITIAAILAAVLIVAVTWNLARSSGPSAGSAPASGGEPSHGTAGMPLYTAGMEASPGLWYGLATVTSGNTGSLYGIPTGWPKTAEGAVSAAMSYQAARVSVAYMVDETGARIDRQIFTPEGATVSAYTAGNREYMRQMFNLTKDGEVREPDGTASGTQKMYLAAYPWYGAYKIDSINEQLDQARIVLWQPRVFGPGTDDDLSQVEINWTESTVTMRWWKDDWRIAVVENKTVQELQPPDESFTNQSFATRREVLPAGDWLVPIDATEEARPGSVLTKN